MTEQIDTKKKDQKQKPDTKASYHAAGNVAGDVLDTLAWWAVFDSIGDLLGSVLD